MARNGYWIGDVDAHYLEPLNDLAEFMEEPLRSQVRSAGANRFVPSGLGDRFVAGRIARTDVPYHTPAAGNSTGAMNRDHMIGAMRRLGIDSAVLVSNGVLRLADSTQRKVAVPFYNAYIDYMLNEVVDCADGLYTMPMLPWQDPKAAATLVDRVGAHDGVVGVCFATSGANPPLGDDRYRPVYAAAERHDLPVVFHGSPATPFISGAFYTDGLEKLIEGHSLGFAISNQIQLTSLLLNGIPEQFPRLKFVFQESGVFWVPAAMYRLDEYFLKRRSEAPLLQKLPSEYVKDQFYFGTQPIESPKNPRDLEAILRMVGIDRWMFASDYPHFDFDDPSAILKLGFLSKDEKGMILGGNARRVFTKFGGDAQWKTVELSRNGQTSQIGARSR
jgi:uncharacterized protein